MEEDEKSDREKDGRHNAAVEVDVTKKYGACQFKPRLLCVHHQSSVVYATSYKSKGN